MWGRRDPPPNGHLQEAVAIATLAAQFTAHQAECTRDKAEIKQALAIQNAERQRMHAENQEKFSKILRYVWIAVGAFGMLQFLAGNGWVWPILKAMHQ